ncbi:MAG TPA: hypothetical protein P5307_04130, partial [Pirellulaceae bacterium]|nr:hypothetical protein [Pirellulaceae bacterium]
MPHDVLRFGSRITALPIIHGSGDFALEVRRMMLEHRFDCVAVPLPPSFQADVEEAIGLLPTPTLVLQRESSGYQSDWTPDPIEDDDDSDGGCSFVPIDPCQGVIMALRVAMGEHITRRFVDLETSPFVPYSEPLPDPYALKKVSLERFAAAVLPTIARPTLEQRKDRITHMASRLRELESQHESILFVCSILDWPWIREAYVEQRECETSDAFVPSTESYEVENDTLAFMLGELPFITGLYEKA